jgi:hypothetical protein
MEGLTREQAEALTHELTQLSKQQLKALQTAAYFRMTPEEAHQYEARPGTHCADFHSAWQIPKKIARPASSRAVLFVRVLRYIGRTFFAWKPFGPFVTSNSTVWPSCRLRKPPAWMAEKCTKTSSPDWRLIKPKPLASLKPFHRSLFHCATCSIVLNFC